MHPIFAPVEMQVRVEEGGIRTKSSQRSRPLLSDALRSTIYWKFAFSASCKLRFINPPLLINQGQKDILIHFRMC